MVVMRKLILESFFCSFNKISSDKLSSSKELYFNRTSFFKGTMSDIISCFNETSCFNGTSLSNGEFSDFLYV